MNFGLYFLFFRHAIVQMLPLWFPTALYEWENILFFNGFNTEVRFEILSFAECTHRV